MELDHKFDAVKCGGGSPGDEFGCGQSSGACNLQAKKKLRQNLASAGNGRAGNHPEETVNHVKLYQGRSADLFLCFLCLRSRFNF